MTRPEPTALESATVSALLADPDRQRVLSYLDPGKRATVEELVDELAARERTEPSADGGPGDRSRIAVSLVHHHLPRLDDHDVVDYRPASNEVVLTTPIAELVPTEGAFEPLVESD
ncbi:hypothetical protein ACFO5R_14050 [Halosolutus amylolyticus]|uniref:DUF7344 domain-containing protein n=1 Tax=Halosolutus amylolyticus TaxID=2932267 RepID=A0ABD5PR21_9EURY|nr:hypothetical protein [Halosolutus amylolyticus]